MLAARRDPGRTNTELNENIVNNKAWLVVVLIVIVAIIPSSLQPIATFPPFYAHLKDVIIVSIGAIAFLLISLGVIRSPIGLAILPCWALLFQAIVGVMNSPYLAYHHELSLFFPIFVMIFTPFFSWATIKFIGDSLPAFMYILACGMAFIAVEYMVAAVVGPMLGFRGGGVVQFGEDRISGSLGNAATLQIAFLPALSTFLEFPKKHFALLGAGLCTAGIILTFSRSAAIALMLYLAYYFLFRWKISLFRRIGMLTLSAIVIFSILMIAEYALASRLSAMEDPGRRQTLETAWQAWLDNPLFGQGYSHVWPWWKREGELFVELRRDRWDGLWEYTDFGLSIWHPHSLIAYIGGEMGVIGLFSTILLGILLVHRLLRQSHLRGLVVALLSSVLVDSLVLGTFSSFAFNILVWWLFSFALLELKDRDTEAKSVVGSRSP